MLSLAWTESKYKFLFLSSHGDDLGRQLGPVPFLFVSMQQESLMFSNPDEHKVSFVVNAIKSLWEEINYKFVVVNW